MSLIRDVERVLAASTSADNATRARLLDIRAKQAHRLGRWRQWSAFAWAYEIVIERATWKELAEESAGRSAPK